jgi:iron complex transport system ATP-binding protein
VGRDPGIVDRLKLRPILRVEGLRVKRGRTTILDGISWTVLPGEHWVILGANGSGKTSLLSALAGYLTPSEGEVSVLGKQYGRADWRELRKRIGLVSSAVRQMMAPDEPALESVLSGRDARADRPWRVLSQGERQRVLIARAMLARPPLLILDEPCAGLDPAAREHFLEFLQKLGRQRSSPTLVLVTHHVEEIMPAFSHLLVLKAGRVLATGRKRHVLTSRVLSSAFGPRIQLRTVRGRHSIVTAPGRGRVV